MELKPSYLSKTLWLNLVVAGLALFVPEASSWLQSNSAVALPVFAALNFALRLISSSKVALW